MEEIGIIELLKRIKEGKAPKKIKIDDTIYYFTNGEDISTMYQDADGWNWLTEEFVTTKTKIIILDKPILDKSVIKELEIRSSRNYSDVNTDVLVYIDNEGKECECFYSVDVYIANKINEIIRYINKKKK